MKGALVNDDLQRAYADYLLNESGKKNLSYALSRVGLELEAEALTRPASQPKIGNDWFNPVECAVMRWVDLGRAAQGWLSERPVSNWQFNGFLQAANPKFINKQTLASALPTQRDKQDPLNPATLIRHDYAYAYCLWMGVVPARHFLLRKLYASDFKKNFISLFQENLGLWDASEAQEGLRQFFSVETAYMEWDDVFKAWEEGRPSPLVSELDAPANVGFATYIDIRLMNTQLPIPGRVYKHWSNNWIYDISPRR